LLFRFAADFEAHLAFEERELSPIVRALDAWGRVRDAAMRSEHREQRRRIEELCTLAEQFVSSPSTMERDDAMTLFEAVSSFADTLLKDMLEEERILAELTRIDECGPDVDQMTG